MFIFYCHLFIKLIDIFRLVSSSKNGCIGEQSTFGIRTGTSKGVVNRAFRVECSRDLAAWLRGLVQGTHNSVSSTREIAWGNGGISFLTPKLLHVVFDRPFILPIDFADCLWKGQEARLCLNYEEGFQLVASNAASTDTTAQKVIWKYPFSRLRNSADDGNRLLWLDFGADVGEIVSTCQRLHLRMGKYFLSKKLE